MNDAETLLPEQPERFEIDSEARANWFLCKIADLELERRRIAAQCKARTSQIDSDLARLNYLFLPQLERWGRRELESRKSRRKTLALLQGSISFRTVPARIQVCDEAEALTWCRANAPEIIRTTTVVSERLDREAYCDRAAGEALPGLVSRPETETMSVKFEAE